MLFTSCKIIIISHSFHETTVYIVNVHEHKHIFVSCSDPSSHVMYIPDYIPHMIDSELSLVIFVKGICNCLLAVAACHIQVYTMIVFVVT